MLDSIIGPLHQVNSVLQRMAVNDFSQPAPENYPGAFGELCRCANAVQARVQNAIRILQVIASGEFTEELNSLEKVGASLRSR